MMKLDHLPNSKPGEKTVLFLRRHWFVPFGILILLIALLAVPIGIYFFFDYQAGWILTHPIASPLLTIVASLFYFAVWVYSFSEFIDYYLDVWIVTNERVINIEQQGLFARTASELNLTAVQDVTSDVRGMFHTVFDFGTVHIQTAGEEKRFVFKQISHPEVVKRQIIQLADQARTKQRNTAAKINAKKD
ncbi:MAG: PH domain-containing protein [Candidatus Uhrbacteria bacterium]